MTIENNTSLHGWHQGAPQKTDFEKGQLLVIYKSEGSFFAHNSNWESHLFLLDAAEADGYIPVYWKRFNPRLSLPADVDEVVFGLSWVQEEDSELCLGF